jgi:hypothetical protein
MEGDAKTKQFAATGDEFAHLAVSLVGPTVSLAAIRSPDRVLLSVAQAEFPAKNWKSCVKPTRSTLTKSAKLAFTTPFGRHLPFSCRFRPSA